MTEETNEAIETLEKTIVVAKETSELSDAVVEVLKTIDKALEDGWQPSEDLPVVVMASVTHLAVGMQGYEKIPAEASSGAPFFNAIVDMAGKVYGIFKK